MCGRVVAGAGRGECGGGHCRHLVAVIPSADGTIHGCFNKKTKALRGRRRGGRQDMQREREAALMKSGGTTWRPGFTRRRWLSRSRWKPGADRRSFCQRHQWTSRELQRLT
jgi:hypothetical protein